jgi:ABC-type sugar transport systems, permease components
MGRLYTPAFNGVANYIELLKDPVFLRSIGNTFLFALATTILKTVVGFLLALVMVKKYPEEELCEPSIMLPV